VWDGSLNGTLPDTDYTSDCRRRGAVPCLLGGKVQVNMSSEKKAPLIGEKIPHMAKGSATLPFANTHANTGTQILAPATR
jgi:hypothetical protein